MSRRVEASRKETKRRIPTRTTVTATPSGASVRAGATSDARRSPPTDDHGRRPRSSRAASEPGQGLRMAIATQGTASNYLQRAPSPSGLADVVELILDKGLVIDLYVRVGVIGIELVTVDARIVVASVDTYLRFAEAVNRLDLNQTELGGLPELQEEGAEKMTEGAIEGVEDEVTPDNPALRKAMKGAAAAAAVGAAAAAARQIASKRNDDGSGDED